MKYIRPEYLFRPTQIIRRVAYGIGLTKNAERARTPWRLPVTFDPNELHGRAMLTLGLSDLRTNEIISRVVRPGDIAVDIGANIGIMTSLMAVRAGSRGSVYAFEPHPSTRARLQANVELWDASHEDIAPVSVLPYAVSKAAGNAQLFEPNKFTGNSGLATLQTDPSSNGKEASLDVETIAFDEWAREYKKIRLIKIDVEGHEDSVLSGMKLSLEEGRIDFILFEEMRPLPSLATKFLGKLGYTSYMIDRSFWGPRLINVETGPKALRGEATNILAMRDPNALDMLCSNGWSCLQ